MNLRFTKPVYIFLDVDGVLNNIKHYKKQHEKYGGRFFCQNMPFNPRSIKNLRDIIDKTGAQIVLTSSWRKSAPCMTVLDARLCEYGIKIHDKTGDLNTRGEEISNWLFNNAGPEEEYIIVDDEMYDIKDYFDENRIVKINPYVGLDLKAKREILNKITQMIK